MEIATYILSFVTLILGGCNILQLITIRSYKRKSNADATRAEMDATRAEMDNLNVIIAQLRQEVQRQHDRLVELERKVCYNADCEQRI